MNNIYICAIAKDEQLYIKHWLDYHFDKGIHQAVIYNNGNTNYDLEGYENKVQIIDWHPNAESGNPQVLAYNNFLSKYNVGRCLFIDIDEYLFGDLPKVGNIVLEDITYDANGNLFYSPAPVTERFTRESKINMTCNLKTYVELSNSGQFISCHRTNAELRDIDGKIIKEHSIPTPTSRTSYLRHYLTKSLEEYKIKLLRGNITNGLRTMEYFYRVNPDINVERNIEMESMDILITANDSYFEASLVTLNSLFTNNNKKFAIHLMHCGDMNKVNVNNMKEFVESRDAMFTSHLVNGLDWLNGKTRYWDKIVMLKLYAWEVLPNNIDKLLYLDSDILVIDSISELWNKDIDKFYFAMRGIDNTTDMSGVYGKHIKTGHTNYVIKRNRFDTHYNAGVILFNLKKLREEKPEWRNFYQENYMRFFAPEEHLMRMLWYDKIMSIEDRWNHITKAHYKEKPFILHYIPKPWINGDVYYLKEYLSYCDIPECQKLYNSIKSHINVTYPHSKETLLNSWLHFEMDNSNYFESFFRIRKYKKIAIYGVDEISELFCYKSEKIKGININYFIDDESVWASFNGKKIIKIEDIEKEESVDAIIIASYERFLEIERDIQKRITHKIDIVSIIEIIYF